VPEQQTANTTRRVVLFEEGDPLQLACGRTLAPIEVAYETYGDPGDPAVVVCHALTGDATASGEDGWWSTMVGPGRPIDTERFFVISSNLLGGCRGTTGPTSIAPLTGEPYGMDFPPIAMEDLVAVQRRLVAHLGVTHVHAAIGGSLGGMQVLEWLLRWPGEVANAILVCASARLSPQNVALSHVARRAILADPAEGMAIARMLGHVTYLSERGMRERFPRPNVDGPGGRGPRNARDWLAPSYDVEHYLERQAEIFLARFDPLTYLYLSRVMDSFDAFAGGRRVDPDTRALVVSFDSDWRFGTEHSAVVAAGLREAGAGEVVDRVIATPRGHDAFLVDVPEYLDAVDGFLRARAA
jgi:homoserine O-acetyltransferase